MCQSRTSNRDEWITLGASLFTVFVSLCTIVWS